MKESHQSLQLLFNVGISIHQLNKKAEKQIGLSIVQWCLLKHLIDQPAISANQLSKIAGVHPSTLTQTLKRLEKKQMIFIAQDPRDSRRKIISITRAGKNLLETASLQLDVLTKKLSIINCELQNVRTQLSKVDGIA